MKSSAFPVYVLGLYTYMSTLLVFERRPDNTVSFFLRKVLEIDYVCFFWWDHIHKLFKFDVNFSVRFLLTIFFQKAYENKKGPFLHGNE